MQAESRPVTSPQAHLHPRLISTVQRHLHSEFRKPIADYNTAAFAQLQHRLQETQQPLIIDSFCGTGRSTATLAEKYPRHLVVGIDKSAHRLERHIANTQENYLLLRAECEAIWQLLLTQQISVDRHYILYPNPWPKPGQLKRRVHGHPSFRTLLELGGEIELRSNWQVYVEEFGVAMHLAGYRGAVTRCADTPPLTLFEEKYLASGHALWRYSTSV